MNNEMQGCDMNLHVYISKNLHERVNLIYQKRGLIATTRNKKLRKNQDDSKQVPILYPYISPTIPIVSIFLFIIHTLPSAPGT